MCWHSTCACEWVRERPARTRAGVERASCRRLKHRDSSHPAAADQAAHTPQNRQNRRWKAIAAGNVHNPTRVTCGQDSALSTYCPAGIKPPRSASCVGGHATATAFAAQHSCDAFGDIRCEGLRSYAPDTLPFTTFPARPSGHKIIDHISPLPFLNFCSGLDARAGTAGVGGGDCPQPLTRPFVASLVLLLPPQKDVLAADQHRLQHPRMFSRTAPRWCYTAPGSDEGGSAAEHTHSRLLAVTPGDLSISPW